MTNGLRYDIDLHQVERQSGTERLPWVDTVDKVSGGTGLRLPRCSQVFRRRTGGV